MFLEMNDPRQVCGWYMYDWANSVYSLVIVSAIFPIYYESVAVSDRGEIVNFLGFDIDNSVLYSYSLSFSFLVVAAILPLLSGISDYSGKKKKFMRYFAITGSLSCMGLFFFSDVTMLGWGVFCFVLASIGYSGSLVFYDAFLPEIVSADRYDSVSARGYTLGYVGSVILLVICLVLIMNHSFFGFADEGIATRVSFLLVGLWWLGFSLWTFRVLPDNPYGKRPTGNIWAKGYLELITVWRDLKHSPDLKKYLTAFFFFNMGVQTIMYLATFFGTKVLNLAKDKLIATILIIQLVGAVGAWLFARISRSRGNKFALTVMILIWIMVCISAYFITTELEFYGLATVVGLIMGGIQSLSRATYAKLIPETTTDHASYFSFYDVTYNLSIVLGTFSYGLIDQISGSMRNSSLALAVYFIIGMLFLLRVRSAKIGRPARMLS